MSKSFEESKVVNNSPEINASSGSTQSNGDQSSRSPPINHDPLYADLMAPLDDRPTPAHRPSSLLVPAAPLPSTADIVDAPVMGSKKLRCSISLSSDSGNELKIPSFQLNENIDFSVDIPKRKIRPKTHIFNPADLSTHPRITLSTQGSGPGEFDYPWGVTFDPSHQRIAVVDSWNHRVQLFDVEGNFLSLFGGPGSAPGRFSEPRGICVQHGTNNIVVADTGNHRLQVFSPEEQQFIFSVVGNTPDSMLKKPYGLSSNRLGQLIVTDVHYHRVQILDSKGVLVRSFGSNGTSADQFDRPSDVFVDDHGRLLIADWRNSRVSIWSGDGSMFLQSFRVPSPDAVCVDPHNRIIVGCGNPLQHASTVCIFDDQAKQLIHQIRAASDCGGEGDEGVDVEPRQLDFPAGVCALEDGSLVVSDCNNQRVLIY